MNMKKAGQAVKLAQLRVLSNLYHFLSFRRICRLCLLYCETSIENVWLFVHAIMMADCPTTGGYPEIGTVVSADLPLLAQCTPKEGRIRFQETTVEEAQKKYRVLMAGLDKIVEDE